MAGETWISLAEAAKFIGKKDVPRRIKGAEMRGMRVGESAPVEIPASEVAGLRIDWVRSSLMLGRLCTMYQSVQMRWADVKRLAQADFERQLREAETPGSPPPKQPLQCASNPASLPTAEAGPKTKAVASALLRVFPEGRPALQNDELMRRVRQAGGENFGVFSLRTLNRAISLAWQPRQTAPNRAKPR